MATPAAAAAAPAAAPLPSLSKTHSIRDVWADNLEAEFRELRDVITQYPYVAMDTEFPGVVAKPVGSFKTTHEFYYQTLRCNVNLLKIIQLGITLLSDTGDTPAEACTWQFNFKFSLTEDIYAQDSIDLLKNGGINFDYFRQYGIDMNHFAELMMTSGLVLNPDVHWLTFHSGYDFGYLLKTITAKELPEKEEDFAASLRLFFPSVYDIKYMLRLTQDLSHTLGLDVLGDILGVRRIGTAHQAGSDSLLTGNAFFKLVKDRFEGQIPAATRGVLYGLSEDGASNATPAANSSGSIGNIGGFGSPSLPANTSPSQYTASQSPPSAAFPSTPVLNMVMHGGNNAKVFSQKQ